MESVGVALIVQKFEKKRQISSILFFRSIIEILLNNFWNNSENFIRSVVLLRDHYWRGGVKAKKKKFVYENPGDRKKVHQAGRESIFFPNFQIIHRN